MPQPKEISQAVKEKRAVRLASFSLSPMYSLRDRLRVCADGEVGVFEPDAEFNAAECRILVEHMQRLEARYNFLWRVAMGTDTGKEVIEQTERAFNQKGAFEPDDAGNWGRS